MFLSRKLFAPAMLLLSSIFLQACTEEMPILAPLNGASNNSTIVLNINNAAYTLTNKAPGYAIFANVTSGTGTTSTTQYNVTGSKGTQTNALDFILAYEINTANKYVLATSQLDFNNKTYTTVNSSGAAKLTVDKMDATANTATGSFGYYLYDSVFTPTDSIYVSGTFNIVK